MIPIGQIIQNRRAGYDLSGLHVERKKLNGVCVVGEQYKVWCQCGRAAATPGKAAAGSLIAIMADLRTDTLIWRAPHNVHTFFRAQQIAVLVRQNDRTVFGGSNAVFCALAKGQPVNKDSL